MQVPQPKGGLPEFYLITDCPDSANVKQIWGATGDGQNDDTGASCCCPCRSQMNKKVEKNGQCACRDPCTGAWTSGLLLFIIVPALPFRRAHVVCDELQIRGRLNSAIIAPIAGWNQRWPGALEIRDAMA